MFFTRRNHALLQRPERAGTHLRRARTLGASILIAGFGLSACDISEPERPDRVNPDLEVREAVVTSAFSTSERAGALSFLPSTDEPWRGLIATALVDGGIDVFTIDGLRVVSASGPQLTALAPVPDFALRGEVFPLVFGADLDGQLRGYAIIRAAEDVVELPLEGPGSAGTVEAACLFATGIGYADIALLGDGGDGRIVRVRDGGGAGLELDVRAQFDLPFAARNCSSTGGDDALLISSPNSGLARVSLGGQVEAIEAGRSINDISYSTLLGRPVALTVSAETGRMGVFDSRTLELLHEIVLNDGINAPGFQSPSALAVTGNNFGGMAFSSGVVAVYDRGDDRVKLVALEVIGRAVMSEES
jgi:hypothetical protein